MIRVLLKLPRIKKQLLLLLIDTISVIGAIFAAFFLRFDYLFSPSGDIILLSLILAAPLFALPIFLRFGLYDQVTRYIGFKALWRIIQAVSLFAFLWGFIAFTIVEGGFPRSIIIINWLLVIVTISTSRFFARWLLSDLNLKKDTLIKNKVLIYGAGSAGRQLSNALKDLKEYKLVAFIDDDVDIYHRSINGLKVYSSNDLEYLIDSNDIKEVLLAIPSVSRRRRNEIIKFLEEFPVIVRSLPGVSELAKGKVGVDDLLEIDLRDLLGRDSAKPNQELLKININKKVVMVTGAGGSIGSELCRQIVSQKPKKLILYEISESSLYLIDQNLIEINNVDVEIVPVIGSVSDKRRLINICNYYGVQTIYHAAAYKHVPLVEFNQSQGVLNNSLGTMIAAEAAIASNVETFVLISTDKAVRPTNVMGASKRVAELILQALAKTTHNTCLTMVRFGNVLDSSGSVIPLFKKQIKSGGPVTVTHPNVVRYFMTIPEAVELVIQAGAMAQGGEVFLLDMGKPVRIYDLAVKMIQLSGLQVIDENHPKGDIQIQFSGLRPGEKLFEELLVDNSYTITENKLIMRAQEEMIDWERLVPLISEINQAAKSNNTEKIYKLLKKIVPQFNSEFNGKDSLKSKGTIK
jgi:FlaA1/EpsC-like NDP-sugar epimerase